MLSLKQQKFCEFYVQSGNATEAAKRAGYSEKTAYSIGQRLLKNVETQKYIKRLTDKPQESRIATADEVLKFFSEMMKSNEVAPKDRIRAAENLAKRFALDKPSEAKHAEEADVGITINIKDCSDNGT